MGRVDIALSSCLDSGCQVAVSLRLAPTGTTQNASQHDRAWAVRPSTTEHGRARPVAVAWLRLGRVKERPSMAALGRVTLNTVNCNSTIQHGTSRYNLTGLGCSVMGSRIRRASGEHLSIILRGAHRTSIQRHARVARFSRVSSECCLELTHSLISSVLSSCAESGGTARVTGRARPEPCCGAAAGPAEHARSRAAEHV